MTVFSCPLIRVTDGVISRGHVAIFVFMDLGGFVGKGKVQRGFFCTGRVFPQFGFFRFFVWGFVAAGRRRVFKQGCFSGGQRGHFNYGWRRGGIGRHWDRGQWGQQRFVGHRGRGGGCDGVCGCGHRGLQRGWRCHLVVDVFHTTMDPGHGRRSSRVDQGRNSFSQLTMEVQWGQFMGVVPAGPGAYHRGQWLQARSGGTWGSFRLSGFWEFRGEVSEVGWGGGLA